MTDINEIIKIFLAFIVLINPSGALAIFLHITADYTQKERHRVAQIAGLTIFITIVLFTLLGEELLRMLGISLGSFRVAGGVLLFMIALSMINGGGNPAKPSDQEVRAKMSFAGQAVVPLAIPMIIGPGGISTVIIYASQFSGIAGKIVIISIGFIISLFCYGSLMAAGRISRILGETGLSILSRVMGILLAAVAVEILVAGLRMIFPELLGQG